MEIPKKVELPNGVSGVISCSGEWLFGRGVLEQQDIDGVVGSLVVTMANREQFEKLPRAEAVVNFIRAGLLTEYADSEEVMITADDDPYEVALTYLTAVLAGMREENDNAALIPDHALNSNLRVAEQDV